MVLLTVKFCKGNSGKMVEADGESQGKPITSLDQSCQNSWSEQTRA